MNGTALWQSRLRFMKIEIIITESILLNVFGDYFFIIRS
jgi:hypothetical protein